jgi:SAM-dependent methyltransferase
MPAINSAAVELKRFWDEQAEQWARFARKAGHDVYYERFNLPPFLELVPPPGRRTLDLGCGEGRVGAKLGHLDHHVVGVDASARMVALARERHEAHVADAADLPFDDGEFDLVVAFMSVMNFDDPEGAVAEVGRVLESGGRFCVAVVHPFDGSGRFDGDGPDARFVIQGSYFDPEPKQWTSDRDGIRVTFYDRPLPLERLFRAHEEAGLFVETVREPRPTADFINDYPVAARRLRVPLFLHLRSVKL